MPKEPLPVPEGRQPRSLPGSPTGHGSRRSDADSYSLVGLTSSALRGLAEILESFFVDPNFHGLYERDPRSRVTHAWARVGNSMQLALGNSVTLEVTHPDGRRTHRVVGPCGSNPEHGAALDKARRAMQSPDRDGADDMIVISVTGQRAESLMACVEGMRSHPEQRQ